MEPSAHVDTFSRDNLPPPGEWPQFLLDNPDVSYPARLNCAVELLDRTIDDHQARGQGARPAIWSDVDGVPHATTYSELRMRVNQAAHVLTGVMGLVPGNRILLRGPNTLHMAIA